jgi:dipeptidyl aminopeptidase/acylaminoacyl peptidase
MTDSAEHTATDAQSARSRHAEIAARLIDQRSAVAQPAVSPDGHHVAFVVATTSLDDNTTRSKVWLDDSPISGGEHDANPTWSPDGRFLAFTSRRGEKKGDSTLHVLPVGVPGETLTVCTMPDGLGDLSWSPDGRRLAFTSRTRDPRYEAKDESWQAPRKIERLLSRLNGEGWVFDRPSHVYVVAADGTGEPRNLTPGEFQHSGTAWLADSTAVITSASRHEGWDEDFASDLYAVPLDADAGIRRLTAGEGQRAHPAVSPDGTRVAFIGFDDMRAMSQNAKVGVISTAADGLPADRITWITHDLDRTFECVNGMQAPVWIDDRTLLATAEDRGDQHLHRLVADGSCAPERLTSGPRTIVHYDAAGDTIATTQTTIERPPELFVDDVRRTHVTEHTEAATGGWEKFSVPTADGSDEIDAWIMRPLDFDESATYPVLLNVHGGPFTQYGEYFFDEAQMQAAAGFVVVLGNPRGGSGRDQAWGWSILGPKHPVAPGHGWGTVDVDDALSIIDGALERYPFCDRGRVGMLGGSYGGFMATWLAGKHGERFRAFCSERAVNNLVAEEWSSDIATLFKMEHGVSHVEDEEEYIRLSPVRFVDDIDKPMLIIHSEEDWRCPIGQAEELWIALRLRGKEVDFYRFPAEDHELSRSGSPVHRVQRAEIILDWFTEKLAPR